MNTVGAVGGMISPLLTPYILSATADLPRALSWRIIFTGLAGAWFVGAVAWLFIDASKPLLGEPARPSAPPPPEQYPYNTEHKDGITLGEPHDPGVRTESENK
jgi:hypothetical protein